MCNLLNRWGVLLITGLLWSTEGTGQAIDTTSTPGLHVSDGVLMKDRRPYRAIGANYFDLFLRLIQNPTNTSSLEGLRQLAKAGIPFVRFSCGGFSQAEWRLYLTNSQEHFRRLDRVVHTAEAAKIGLIPSVFWTFALPETAGETRDRWLQSESRGRILMRGYVTQLVRRYKNSPALWGWEFGNELNLSVDLPNAAQFRQPEQTERDDLTSRHLTELIAEFGRTVRAIDGSRPIFSGNSLPRPSAWHNTNQRSWERDTRQQSHEILLRDNPAPLDTIGVHVYASDEGLKDLPDWAPSVEDYLKWVRELAQGPEVRRPVFVGEFGALAGTDSQRRQRFESLLKAIINSQVDLAAFWVFDLSNQEADWNASFTNSRSWMLKAVAQANEEIGKKKGQP